MFTFIGELVTSIQKTFGGLIDFITVFFREIGKKLGKVFTTFSKVFGMVFVPCLDLL